jgi:hypothetical protein
MAIEALTDAIKAQSHRVLVVRRLQQAGPRRENGRRNPPFLQFNEHWVDPYLNPNVEQFIRTNRLPKWAEQWFSSGWTAMSRLSSSAATSPHAKQAKYEGGCLAAIGLGRSWMMPSTKADSPQDVHAWTIQSPPEVIGWYWL